MMKNATTPGPFIHESLRQCRYLIRFADDLFPTAGGTTEDHAAKIKLNFSNFRSGVAGI